MSDTTSIPPGRPPYSVLSVEREAHVATLFLDRPEKRNAMGMPLFAELPRAMAELGRDRSLRAIVLAAKGPHFSVGLDLTALADVGGGEPPGGATAAAGGATGEPAGEPAGGESRPSHAELARRTHDDVLALQGAIDSVADCRIPVVAAVHGYCIGGGVDLVSACDIRVCSSDAVFSVRETKMAMVADLGSLARLPLLLAMGHVAELVYTGKDLDAARALQIGLVNHVFDDSDAALAGARAIAAEIAANSPLAVEGAKAVLSLTRRSEIDLAQRYVAAWNAGQLRSHDLTEAVTAFFERRPPEFSGR